MRETLRKLLDRLHACDEAQAWVGTHGLKWSWFHCKRGDWMLWLLGKMAGTAGWPTRQEIVLCCCDIAEQALAAHWKLADQRPADAIRVARAWARGEVTLDEVRSAAAAAYAAATAAYAAAAAAYAAYAADAAAAATAATAAAAAATAAYAADAAAAATAAAAAYAAATAAYAADAAAAAYAAYAAATAAATAARGTRLAEIAEMVRERFTPPGCAGVHRGGGE